MTYSRGRLLVAIFVSLLMWAGAVRAEASTAENRYEYGRFTVIVQGGGERQTIYLGDYTPSAITPRATKAAHAIFVDYSTKEFVYYRRLASGKYTPLFWRAAFTPKPEYLRRAGREEVRGLVERIDVAPTWCPTANIRRTYPWLAPGCLPFGHAQNAMGSAKFEIAWQGMPSGWDSIRVHGTAGYPEGNFWDLETFGCTSLDNDSLAELVRLLGPTAVKEGIEVVVYTEDQLKFLGN